MPIVGLLSLALLRWRERQRGKVVSERELPPITIFRPCEGAERDLEAALRSSFVARYPAARVVVVCTPGEGDAATAVARRVCSEWAHTRSRVVFDRPDSLAFTNPKARRLFSGELALDTPLVVQVDADVVLEDDALVSLVTQMSSQDAVAIYAAPIVAAEDAWGSRVLRAVLGGSLHAFPILHALTAVVSGAPLAVGSLLAYRRDALPEGVAVAADRIGDDLAMARALASRGTVMIARAPVVCDHAPVSLASARALLRRWVHVAMSHAPSRWLGYPTMFAATPWLLALTLVLAAMPSARWLAALCAAACAARVAGALVVRAVILGERPRLRSAIDTLVGEAVLLECAAAGAFDWVTGRELRWRRRLYRVARGGRIVGVREEATWSP